jgi:uncharacterized membrane protein
MEPANKAPNVDKLEDNIAKMHKLRMNYDRNRTWDHKLADRFAFFLGSLRNLYIHVFIYVFLFSLLYFQVFGHYGTYAEMISLLSSIATIEALFLTIFILINQRHTSALERKNSDLHLQMSMLAEHEVTKLLQLTHNIAKHVGVPIGDKDGELRELKKDIDPDHILQKIFEQEKSEPTDITKPVQ